ncbi:MAG TPA: type II toxin-antitoxin system VapC family toxin [Caldilineae bacterium]|nr:type II toxin-antitoxin system VapC family toxin [Caldilineae bacterium]
MIIYLDTSALVKVYIEEASSSEVIRWISEAEVVGVSLLSKVEVAAAFAKAARMGIISRQEADVVWKQFLKDWPSLYKIKVHEYVLDKASELAWTYGLRGYDAVHLAVALYWQDVLGEAVTMVSFDRLLWRAAVEAGLSVLPDGR